MSAKVATGPLAVVLLSSCLLFSGIARADGVRCDRIWQKTEAATELEVKEEAFDLTERLLNLQTRSPRSLSQYELYEFYKTELGDLKADIENAVMTMKTDPEAVSLIQAIKVMEAGNTTILRKLEVMDRLLNPGRWRKMLSRAKSAEQQLNDIANAISSCRSNAMICQAHVKEDIGLLLEHVDAVATLELRLRDQVSVLEATAKNLQSIDSSSSVKAMADATLTEAAQLTPLIAVLEGHLSSIQSEVNRSSIAMRDLDSLKMSIMLMVNKGAPVRALEVAGTAGSSRAGALPGEGLIGRKLAFELQTRDPSVWLRSLYAHMMQTTYNNHSDRVALFLLENFPLPQSTNIVMSELGDTSAKPSYTLSRIVNYVNRRELTNDQWMKAIELADRILDHYYGAAGESSIRQTVRTSFAKTLELPIGGAR